VSPTVRMSADERREHVLRASMIEFGAGGFVGTSTEAIARRVGVSQPYLFRLFPTKRALFIATMDRCFDNIVGVFRRAADGLTGEDALMAMGAAYKNLLDDRELLQMQLQMWAAACQDGEIRDVTRRRMTGLWQLAQSLSQVDDDRIMQFMAAGMLHNVMAAMDLPRMREHLGESLMGLAGDAAEKHGPAEKHQAAEKPGPAKGNDKT
ncbi:MAG TPA: TetR/AcrR family transcriptional regulator, partial [Micromonosporaceae bacterium]